ncbi:MAG: hypothetical protein LBK00_03140 [Treponema sp.]|nr:hypothetical protein [Treponema sp.]
MVSETADMRKGVEKTGGARDSGACERGLGEKLVVPETADMRKGVEGRWCQRQRTGEKAWERQVVSETAERVSGRGKGRWRQRQRSG